KRYKPPHLSLFDEISQELGRAIRNKRIEIAKPEADKQFGLVLSGEDRPRLLYEFLQILFDNTMNLKDLRIIKESYAIPSQGKIKISVVVSPWYAWTQTPRQLADNCKQAVANELRGYQLRACSVSELYRAAPQTPDFPSLDQYYEIHVADVPGMVKTI